MVIQITRKSILILFLSSMLLAVVLFSTSAIAVPRAVFNVTGSNATTISEDTMSNLTVTVFLDGAGTDNVTEVNFTIWSLDATGLLAYGKNITSAVPATQHASIFNNVNVTGLTFLQAGTPNYTVFSWSKASATQGIFNSSAPATFSVLVNVSYPNAAYKLEVSTIQGNGTLYRPVNLTVNVTEVSNAYISLPAANITNQTYNALSIIAGMMDNDTAVSSISIYVHNSTGNVVNTSQQLTNGGSLTANFTSMADGIYHINVTVNDTGNSFNTTRRSVTIDTAGPSITLTKTDSTKTSIDLSVAVTDGTSGVPTAMGCTTNRGTRSGTGSGQTITESGLGCGNSYSYTVSCTDEAGNGGSTTASFSTDNCGSSGGSSGSSGGSSGSGSGIDVDADLTETSTTSLKGSQGVIKTFSVDGQAEHKVTFTTVNDDSVTLKFQSSPILVTVNKGETKMVDLDNNGSNDVEVTLDSVSSGVASITLKNLSDAVVTPPTDDTTGTDQPTTPPAVDDGGSMAEPGENMPADEGGLSTGVIIAIVVVLLVVIGAGVYFFLNRD